MSQVVNTPTGGWIYDTADLQQLYLEKLNVLKAREARCTEKELLVKQTVEDSIYLIQENSYLKERVHELESDLDIASEMPQWKRDIGKQWLDSRVTNP